MYVHFDDLDDLFAAAGARQAEEVAHLLYAVDTSTYPEATFESLKGAALDALVLDATKGEKSTSDNHLSIEGAAAVVERLRALGALKPRCRVIATHFSHHCVPPHEALEDRLRALNMGCAYDGMELELP